MKNILFLTVFGLSLMSGYAQNERDSNNRGAVNNRVDFKDEFIGILQGHMKFAIPQGEFANTYSESAFFGLGAGLLFQVLESPIDAGLTVDYFWMERQQKDFTVTDPQFGNYDVTSTINGNVVPIHGVIRVTPLRTVLPKFNPYIEGLAGFRVFSIRTKIEVDDGSNTTQPEPEIDRDPSAAWSYGYAAGLYFEVSPNFNIDLGVANVYGSNASYIDAESLRFTTQGDPVYERKESKTHVVNIRAGVNILF
jgi:opacity protein-like surface antigen